MPVTNIIFRRSFEKSYLKQKEKIKNLIKQKIRVLLEEEFHPILHNHKLQGEWEGCRSININGDIRAIYKSEGKIAVFVAVGTHSELYE